MSDVAVRSERSIAIGDSHVLAVQALDALKDVTTPDEAESLLARVKVAAEAARVMHLGKALSRDWRTIEIKAERKWGELLGKAEPKNRHSADIPSVTGGHASSDSERKAVKEARKIFAVPEAVFEEYVETAEQPSKAGLLRTAAMDAIAGGATLAEAGQALGVCKSTVGNWSAEASSDRPLTRHQANIANASRDRVEKTLHTLDGMCTGLAAVDPQRATITATEEQVTQWLAMAEQARKHLHQFAGLIRAAS